MNTKQLEKTLHLQCGKAVDMVIKSSLIRKSLDNVTCLMVTFKNFETCYESLSKEKYRNYDKVPIQVPQTAKNMKGKGISLEKDEYMRKSIDKTEKLEKILDRPERKDKSEKLPSSISFQQKIEDSRHYTERYEKIGDYGENLLGSPSGQKAVIKSVLENTNPDLYNRKNNGAPSNYSYVYSGSNPVSKESNKDYRDEEKYENHPGQSKIVGSGGYGYGNTKTSKDEEKYDKYQGQSKIVGSSIYGYGNKIPQGSNLSINTEPTYYSSNQNRNYNIPNSEHKQGTGQFSYKR